MGLTATDEGPDIYTEKHLLYSDYWSGQTPNTENHSGSIRSNLQISQTQAKSRSLSNEIHTRDGDSKRYTFHLSPKQQ